MAITRLWIGEPKGIDLVIRSLPQLPDVDFEVVGDGAARPQLVDLAQSLGVADRVHFVGRLSETEKHAAIARSHALVLPSSGEALASSIWKRWRIAKPCLAAAWWWRRKSCSMGKPGLSLNRRCRRSVRGFALARSIAAAALGDAGYQRLYDHFTYAAFARHAEPFLRAFTERFDGKTAQTTGWRWERRRGFARVSSRWCRWTLQVDAAMRVGGCLSLLAHLLPAILLSSLSLLENCCRRRRLPGTLCQPSARRPAAYCAWKRSPPAVYARSPEPAQNSSFRDGGTGRQDRQPTPPKTPPLASLHGVGAASIEQDVGLRLLLRMAELHARRIVSR